MLVSLADPERGQHQQAADGQPGQIGILAPEQQIDQQASRNERIVHDRQHSATDQRRPLVPQEVAEAGGTHPQPEQNAPLQP